ncbi:MAG: hypothetical protein M1816_002587 [Peltula sp. TS41687]|nr:MAG: hypothetical protein M1816_002587 [Peltula sp. TS41687]
MAGAGKKRMQADRRRGGQSRPEASTVPTPPVEQPQSPIPEDVVTPEADRPFGLDGGNSPPPGSTGPGSVPGSTAGGPRAPTGESATRRTDINRRLDLPPAAFNLDGQYKLPTELPARGKGNTLGQVAKIRVNSYNITKFPDRTVFQYDVHIGNGAEKRGLIRRVWESKTMQKATGPGWIFDGNKLAWAITDKGREFSMVVDLDAEQGRPPRPGREDDNKHRVTIRKTTNVPLGAIDAYLKGKITFDSSVLIAINFLDHLIRHSPSQRLTSIKQSFFTRGADHYPLGGGAEAFKGIFQTIRTCQGGRLALNVDVSNGSFWAETNVMLTAQFVVKARDVTDLYLKLQDVNVDDNGGGMTESSSFKELRRLRKLEIYPRHRGLVGEKSVTYFVEGFTKENSKEFMFEVKNKTTGKKEVISVYDYFRERYKVTLLNWNLPLIQTTKKGVVLPMEISWVCENQKYPFKLDDQQTSKMIKYAVTRPEERMKDIEHGIKQLKWDEDIYLKNYGLSISPKMIETTARILPPPKVEFQGSTVTPGYSGRWDLRGPRKFLTVNTVPLVSWAVCICQDRNAQRTIDTASVQNFVREFIKTYQGHGGRVENKAPPVIQGPFDPAKCVEQAMMAVAKMTTKPPQMLMFVLSDRTSFHYARIKKSADCRYGVLSQCMQATHVQKVNGQYMSNVCMKFNAKLGGATARVAGKNANLGHFTEPSVILGADVSHASPGIDMPSMAAMTCSMDKIGVRYAAACQTNGRRVEMITRKNIREQMVPLVGYWIKHVNDGKVPQTIYYFRDGVSEGQYQHVLQQEVNDMRTCFREKNPNWHPKFVVVVASKRHHIRFFPKYGDKVAADRNGNPVPGTLVEYDVTHPFENDFYLCSHSAIQGTARPVHYHVLLDEANISANQLHTMIYEQCYSYIRATTPVSLHPAVYYAHLASNRARTHENIPASSGPRSGPDAKKSFTTKIDPLLAEGMPLLAFGTAGDNTIQTSMWYI